MTVSRVLSVTAMTTFVVLLGIVCPCVKAQSLPPVPAPSNDDRKAAPAAENALSEKPKSKSDDGDVILTDDES
ncbi:hypothetical protein Ccrd_008967 [Cynara cardunculus var. scolymus]|uniref:Secreted protein n=1 Tax=Cynara cardunculus var. scolymus TaxID=59895 RepID=A0A118JSE6_CYNCS|nr:hypothetical protein Ccrd_008967 [Cynara cardunculus var. scolymus]